MGRPELRHSHRAHPPDPRPPPGGAPLPHPRRHPLRPDFATAHPGGAAHAPREVPLLPSSHHRRAPVLRGSAARSLQAFSLRGDVGLGHLRRRHENFLFFVRRHPSKVIMTRPVLPLIVLTVALAATSIVPRAEAAGLKGYQRQLLRLHNVERKKRNRPPLRISGILNRSSVRYAT